jgi:16S rRNA processing protein RimM
LKVLSLRKHTGQNLVVHFQDFASMEDAETLRGLEIFMPADDLPKLGEGNYYHHQLIGIAVQSTDGSDLGILGEIIDTNGNNVYMVAAQDGTEILVPAIADAIKSVDIMAKIMIVERDFCVLQHSKQ